MPTGNSIFNKATLLIFRMPLYGIVANFILVNTVYLLLPYGTGNNLYNISRIIILGYAGWLVIRKNVGGLFCAAMSGVILYFIEHVVLNSELWIIRYMFSPKGLYAISLGDIFVSFLKLIPLAMLFTTIGGLFAQSLRERTSMDS